MTTVERTLVDLLLHSDRETAISMLDAALRRRRIGNVERIRAMAAHREGIAARRSWLELVDGRSESPLESRIRLLLTDEGLPPEELQWPVWEFGDSDPRGSRCGRVLARLDLAWPSRMLAIEADGAQYHEKPSALFYDRTRQNALLAVDWRLLRFTWADALRRPRDIAAIVRPLLESPIRLLGPRPSFGT